MVEEKTEKKSRNGREKGRRDSGDLRRSSYLTRVDANVCLLWLDHVYWTENLEIPVTNEVPQRIHKT